MVITTYHSPLGDIALTADERGLTGLSFVDADEGPGALARDARSFDMYAGAFGEEGRVGGEEDAAGDAPASPMEKIVGSDAYSGSLGAAAADARNAAAVSVLERAWAWLNAYFAGQAPRWTPPLHIEGSDFQHAVWVALLEIPYGQAITCEELAQSVFERCGGLRSCAPYGRDGASYLHDVALAVADNPVPVIIPSHRVTGMDAVCAENAGGKERTRRLLDIESSRRPLGMS